MKNILLKFDEKDFNKIRMAKIELETALEETFTYEKYFLLLAKNMKLKGGRNDTI
jgi:hypothetical protein